VAKLRAMFWFGSWEEASDFVKKMAYYPIFALKRGPAPKICFILFRLYALGQLLDGGELSVQRWFLIGVALAVEVKT
jgi:hypothetical protein